MGKRSNFEKIPKDAYMTIDPRAIRPLVEYYQGNIPSFYEPCAGNGDLINLLNPFGECIGSSDEEFDARTHSYKTKGFEYFISNPPWTREILHPIIENLRKQKPTWLLFDSDWMFTAQSNSYMQYCKLVLPVGRLIWMPGTKQTGKDNCAWYLFVEEKTDCIFVPKLEKVKK